jgi:hypothetical protein
LAGVELVSRAHVSVRGEREDTKNGRRESKKKMYSTKVGQQREWRPTKEVDRCGEAKPARPDPKREFKGKIEF